MVRTSCKFHCTQVTSKAWAMPLLQVTPWGTSWRFGVRQGPAGNSELPDFFRDMESNPEAKPSIHQLDPQQLGPRRKGFSLADRTRAAHTGPGHVSAGTCREPAEPGHEEAGGSRARGADRGSAGELQLP